MAFTISGTAGATFPDSTTQTTAFSTPVSVADGGTGVTSSTGTTSVVLSNAPTITNPTITNRSEEHTSELQSH